MYRHLLDRLVRIAGTFPDCEVLVVTRYEEIRESVEALRTNGEPVRCVWSPESAKGASYFYPGPDFWKPSGWRSAGKLHFLWRISPGLPKQACGDFCS